MTGAVLPRGHRDCKTAARNVCGGAGPCPIMGMDLLRAGACAKRDKEPHVYENVVQFQEEEMSSSTFGMSTRRRPAAAAVTAFSTQPKSAKAGLPSPTGSSSETSDYQRSTPSPRDGGDDCWASSETDPGFSEGDSLVPSATSTSTKSKTRRRATLSAVDDIVEKDPKLMLQHVRVALEKIHTVTSLKRRHSDEPSSNSSCAKKPRPLSSSGEQNHISQGKITAYMSETKHFTALRKEKLDRILNLKTDDVGQRASPPSMNPKHHHNDLFLISQLKQLKTTTSTRSIPLRAETRSSSKAKAAAPDLKTVKKEVEDEEDNTTNSAKDSDDCFVEPASSFSSSTVIRFPKAEPLDVVRCKWEGCEETMESTGKLLDHLKVSVGDKFMYAVCL